MWVRYDVYNTKHPDNDELYQLERIERDLDFKRVFDNKEVYGDHTSFPGEFLFYYLPLKLLNKDITVYMREQRVEGLTRGDVWMLAIPKILITVLGFFGFWLILKGNWYGVLGYMMYALNPNLVYHAFEMRPYSVLPVLAIFNLLLCSYFCEKNSIIIKSNYRPNLDLSWVSYALLFFFTCIYHAYGILITLSPLIYFSIKEKKFDLRFLCVIGASMFAWSYYASFNSFGATPNKTQAVVDSFQYFPKTLFFENMIRQLTGGGLIFYCLCPILLIGLFKGKDLLFLGLLVILPMTLICLVDLKTSYWIHPRQWIWVIPFFIIFCVNKLEDICQYQKEQGFV